MDTPDAAQRPVILALGSPHGDDQTAWCVADRLSHDPLFHGTCTRLASPWDLIPYLDPGQSVIIIDACRSGAAAGTIHRLTAQEVPHQPKTLASSHGSSLTDALSLAAALGHDLSQVVIYAVEMEACQPGAPLSAVAYRAAEDLAIRIQDALADGRTPR